MSTSVPNTAPHGKCVVQGGSIAQFIDSVVDCIDSKSTLWHLQACLVLNQDFEGKNTLLDAISAQLAKLEATPDVSRPRVVDIHTGIWWRN